MCGIVGIITAKNNGFDYKETGALRDMAYADTLRGLDSTGLMYGTNNGAVQIHKEASPGFRFLTTKEWDSSRSELFTRGKWAVVHNRAATRGGKTDKNAHPFIVDDKIVLVQNGTYKGSHKHLKDTEVDTEACAHVLAENGNISAALKTINAAYAFVWYNVEDKTLYIVRNDERPLFIAEAKSGSILFASEGGILDFACQRNDIDIETGPYLLASGHLLSYKMENGEATESYGPIDIDYVPRKEDTPPFQVDQTMDGKHGRSVISLPTGKPRVPYRPGVSTHGVAESKGPLSIPRALELVNGDLTPVRTVSLLNALQDLLTENRTKSFTIEGQDYVKINELDPTDGHYYVFGTILAPEQELDGELVVWEVEHRGGTATEQELMRYVTDNFFRAKLNYLIRRAWTDGGWLSAFYLNDGVEVIGSRVSEVEH